MHIGSTPSGQVRSFPGCSPCLPSSSLALKHSASITPASQSLYPTALRLFAPCDGGSGSSRSTRTRSPEMRNDRSQKRGAVQRVPGERRGLQIDDGKKEACSGGKPGVETGMGSDITESGENNDKEDETAKTCTRSAPPPLPMATAASSGDIKARHTPRPTCCISLFPGSANLRFSSALLPFPLPLQLLVLPMPPSTNCSLARITRKCRRVLPSPHHSSPRRLLPPLSATAAVKGEGFVMSRYAGRATKTHRCRSFFPSPWRR